MKRNESMIQEGEYINIYIVGAIIFLNMNYTSIDYYELLVEHIKFWEITAEGLL